MSENPFGGFDMNALLEQAQQMQQQLVDAQAQLSEETVEGSVAGGVVTVVLSGTGEVTEVRITPEALEGTDAESLADLGDLVVAAYRDAKGRADALAGERLGPLAGGFDGGADAGPGGDLGGLDLGGLLGGGDTPRA